MPSDFGGAAAGELPCAQGPAAVCAPALHLCYLGTAVPDTDDRLYPAYSRAGNLLQERILEGLAGSGLRAEAVLCGRPVPSFPRMRRLWFSRDSAVLDNGLRADLLAFLNLGALKTLSLGLAATREVLRWARTVPRSESRLVVAYNLNSPHGLALLIGARLAGAKAVAIIADLMLPGHGIGRSPFRLLDWGLQKWVLRHLDGLVVLSPAVIEDFAPGVPWVQMEGGLPESVSLRLAELPLAKEQETFTFLYAGQLDSLRGVDLLLQAFERLQDPRLRLLLAGRGPLEEEVSRYAARDPRCRFLGYLGSYDEVLRCYSQSSALVSLYISRALSTRYLFPSKLLECLATGRPVIASPSPGVREQYGDYAILLEEETSEALARLMRQVAGSPAEERARLGRRQQRFILEQKNWQVQGAVMSRFLRRVAGG